MIDTSLLVPTLYTGTPAYDADFNPTLRFIDVLAAGTLRVVDINDNAVTYNFATSSVEYPKRIALQVKRIVGDGVGGIGTGTDETDIALTNLVLLQ